MFACSDRTAGYRKITELVDVLNAAEQIAAKRKVKTVVVFDEFQQIANYDDQLIERQLRSIVQILLGRENYAFTITWQNLTRNQQRLLRGLADANSTKPFSAVFTRKWGLRSASNVQRAAQSLVQNDIIERENGTFAITDRFFRLWILALSF